VLVAEETYYDESGILEKNGKLEDEEDREGTVRPYVL